MPPKRPPDLFTAPAATDLDTQIAAVSADLEAAKAEHAPYATAFWDAHNAIAEAIANGRAELAHLYDRRMAAGQAGFPTKQRVYELTQWLRSLQKSR
jgi:hypothetical protein